MPGGDRFEAELSPHLLHPLGASWPPPASVHQCPLLAAGVMRVVSQLHGPPWAGAASAVLPLPPPKATCPHRLPLAQEHRGGPSQEQGGDPREQPGSGSSEVTMAGSESRRQT